MRLDRSIHPPASITSLRHEGLISQGLLQPLSALPYHATGPLERRLMAGEGVHPGSGTHIAVHRVGPVEDGTRSYSAEHSHTVPEFNLILPIDSLVYDITLDQESYVVEGPASIYIPAGVTHSANVRAGHGFFIAIVLDAEDYAKSFDGQPSA